MKNTTTTCLLLAILLFSSPSFSQLTKVTKSGNAQELYDQGVKLKDDKKMNDALEKFKQAITVNPDFTDALFQAGWCENELGNYNNALSYLRKARQAWVSTPKVYFEIGYAFEKLNNNDSAIKNYYKCIDLKPDYSLAYKQLGYIAYNKSENETALAQFKKYEENTKTEINDYLYWYRKGFVNNALKNYSDAKTALLKAQGYKTDYTNTYLELGYASFKLKQDDEAIGYYKKAMDLDPKSHVPYNGIAEIYRDNKKDMDQAMTWYRKALDINRTERKANFGMGYCLNSRQQYSDAASYLETAIASENTYTAAYVELGYSYFKLGRDAEAAVKFNKAISLSPKNENARYYACLMYIKQKNKTMAQKMVDELRSLSSKYASELQTKVDAL